MTTGVTNYGVTVPTNSSTSTSTTDMSALSSNYTMFLQLLTTQLKNQDPTSPMDANQFTQQLVQYSQVEQQIKSNSTLTSIASSLSVANATQMLSYIGQTVSADGTKTTLQNGNAEWSFTLDRSAAATINVLDSSGNVVYTQSTTYGTGTNTFDWNGSMTSGGTAPDGAYTLQISAQDAAGTAAKVTQAVSGTVTGIDFSSGQPYLTVNGSKVSIWSVSAIGTTTSSGS
ncbi:MAG: flagellar hook capping FlgD N-terminal domain-containing protein [Ancalomicrobiaceae bacterium]|nr:flagellar hook capping FlgD N-terminal domain-containing protein [Ancalomicrobiaceae bacterium]